MFFAKLLRGERYYTICVRPYLSKEKPFKSLLLHERYWYADPLGIDYNGKLFVFMEVFDKKVRKGYIGVSQVDKEGNMSTPEKVIEEQWHLSFPFVFKKGDSYYMIPESCKSEKLWLYKCKQFPLNWEAVSYIEKRPNQVDTVIFEREGKYYAVSSDIDPNNSYRSREKIEELVITGDRMEMRPSDLSFFTNRDYDYSSRSGGGFIDLNDSWKRVIQVSKEGIYGVAIEIRDSSINEGKIYEFAEALIDVHSLKEALDGVVFVPSEKRIGIHTYGIVNGMEIIDLSYWHFSMQELYYLSLIHI